MENKIFNGIYLFSDIDGTFASTDDFIPQKNLEAVKYFTDNGGVFSIATGRYIGDLELLENVNINGISIINNGASLYDFKNKKELSSITLDEEDIKRLYEFLSLHKDLGLLIANKDGYINAVFDEYERPIFHQRHKTMKIEDIKLPFNKMLIVVNPMIMDRTLNDLKEFNLKKVDFVQTGDHSIEIVPKDISKGVAFLKIIKENKIDIKNTYFIGDSFNDIEFMKVAGFSAAVEDAKEEVKKSAKIIVSDFESGAVASFIEYIKNKL